MMTGTRRSILVSVSASETTWFEGVLLLAIDVLFGLAFYFV